MKLHQQVRRLLQFSDWPRPQWKWPELQAHRGHWILGDRENTLASLAQAQAQGYEMAEIDIRLARDEIPVLAHDKDLVRLCSLNLRVKDLSAQELSQWDFPTLADVLKSGSMRPRLMNIEIKNDDRLDSLLEKKVLDVIINSGRAADVMVSSFNPMSLRYFSENAPNIPRALLIEPDRIEKISYWRVLGNLAARAHMVNWPYKLLTKDLVRLLKDSGIPVVAWTVNDYRAARELRRWGVDSVISDQLLPQRFKDFSG